uniref:Pentatricopeptide repeat-containing protein n=1 Tax=Cannabis sativa TaxID=3483 RepID=A0A803QBI2_CANSA
MGEWGCYPNAETYLVLTKSLYQAARVGEGDEMIDRMKSAGYGELLNKKEYYSFLKILCGIERIDHALSVFEKMKKDGCEPGIKTYDLLMGKLCSHNRLDKANSLFNDALRRGIPVEPKAYQKKKSPQANSIEFREETKTNDAAAYLNSNLRTFQIFELVIKGPDQALSFIARGTSSPDLTKAPSPAVRAQIQGLRCARALTPDKAREAPGTSASRLPASTSGARLLQFVSPRQPHTPAHVRQ